MVVKTVVVEEGMRVVVVVVAKIVVEVASVDTVEGFIVFDVVLREIDDVVLEIVVDDWVGVFGIRESTIPTGPFKSISDSGHVNSSG